MKRIDDRLELVDDTRRRAPDWCVEVWRAENAFVVVDNRGRYWRARIQVVTEFRSEQRPRAVSVLVGEFGPCETIDEALTTGL